MDTSMVAGSSANPFPVLTPIQQQLLNQVQPEYEDLESGWKDIRRAYEAQATCKALQAWFQQFRAQHPEKIDRIIMVGVGLKDQMNRNGPVMRVSIRGLWQLAFINMFLEDLRGENRQISAYYQEFNIDDETKQFLAKLGIHCVEAVPLPDKTQLHRTNPASDMMTPRTLLFAPYLSPSTQVGLFLQERPALYVANHMDHVLFYASINLVHSTGLEHGEPTFGNSKETEIAICHSIVDEAIDVKTRSCYRTLPLDLAFQGLAGHHRGGLAGMIIGVYEPDLEQEDSTYLLGFSKLRSPGIADDAANFCRHKQLIEARGLPFLCPGGDCHCITVRANYDRIYNWGQYLHEHNPV
jgi:hypothetical protein